MKSLKIFLIPVLFLVACLSVASQSSEKEDLAKVQQLANQGNTAEASNMLLTMMERYPDNFEVIQTYMKVNMPRIPGEEGMLKELQELEKKFPGNSAILFGKTFIIMEQGNLDEALASAEKLTTIRQDNSLYWLMKGQIQEALNKNDEAYASYEKSTTLDPSNVDAWQIKAGLLHKQGKFDDAIASYNKAIELAPSQPVFIYNRGCAYNRKGDKTNALADLAKAISLDPQFKAYAAKDEDYKSLWDNEEFKKLVQ